MTVASPETLVTKDGEQVATYPLAGTRRRGRTPRIGGWSMTKPA